MVSRNQRGQILIESVFLIILIGTVLIAFQIMIDQQKAESNKYRMSKCRKDVVNDTQTQVPAQLKE